MKYLIPVSRFHPFRIPNSQRQPPEPVPLSPSFPAPAFHQIETHIPAPSSFPSQALVVKSVSFPQLQDPAALHPQAQESLPQAAFLFSTSARAQLHWPAGRAWHEQRSPDTVFSTAALSQLHFRAGWAPQEQVAC
jgi:hypothetical protein